MGSGLGKGVRVILFMILFLSFSAICSPTMTTFVVLSMGNYHADRNNYVNRPIPIIISFFYFTE